MTLHGDLQCLVANRKRKAFFPSLIYDIYLVLYLVKLRAGDCRKTSRKMILGHLMVLSSRKFISTLKLVHTCLAWT